MYYLLICFAGFSCIGWHHHSGHWACREGIYPHPLQEVTPSTFGCQPSDVIWNPPTIDWIKMCSLNIITLALPTSLCNSDLALISENSTCAILVSHVRSCQEEVSDFAIRPKVHGVIHKTLRRRLPPDLWVMWINLRLAECPSVKPADSMEQY